MKALRSRAWEAVQGVVIAAALVAIVAMVAAAGILSRSWGQ